MKKLKAPHLRSTFWSWDVEKCTPFWREAHLQVKKLKTPHVRTSFGSWDVEKVHTVVARSTFPRQNVQNTPGPDHFWKLCIFRGRRSTRDMFIRAVRRSGRWFPERGCILEHQIFRFAEMILRDKCSTSYDLASLFRGSRNTLDRWTGKIAKRIGTRMFSSVLNFPFLKEVLQNSFVFDVVNFENWGSLAELFSFLMLSSSRIEEVSQNFCVFDVVNFDKLRKSRRMSPFSSLQIDREIDR